MCGYLIWILKLCTDFEFVFAEFRPGEPWKGYPNIDPETDPYVTPGSVINSLSINTVREVDHLRDRNSGTWGMGWCENAVQQCGMITGQDGLALTLTVVTLNIGPWTSNGQHSRAGPGRGGAGKQTLRAKALKS